MRILRETREDTPNPAEYWEGKEFEDISEDRSYCSSVHDENEDNLHDKDRVVPYDFVSIRKAKRFFKEDYVNLTRAAISKEYIEAINNQAIQRDLPGIDAELKTAIQRQKKDLGFLMSRAFARGLQGYGQQHGSRRSPGIVAWPEGDDKFCE